MPKYNVNEINKGVSENTSILKEYFALYLSSIRNLKKSSVNHYLDALNNISRRLVEAGLVQIDIY